LESYHPYLQVQKVSKIPKIECTHGGLPKTAKSHFGCLRTLGVKVSESFLYDPTRCFFQKYILQLFENVVVSLIHILHNVFVTLVESTFVKEATMQRIK
jgi:hypothetical protein